MTGKSFSVWLNNEYIPNNPDKIWIKEAYSKAVKKSIEDGCTAFTRFFKHQSAFPNFKKKDKSDVKMYFVKNNPKDCNLSLYPRQENQMKIRNPLPTIPALSKAFGSFSCNVRKERDRFSPCSFPCRHPPVLYESDTVFLTHAFYPCSG